MLATVARPYLEHVHPDDRDSTVAESAAVADGKTTLMFENRYQRKDGSHRLLEWTATPVVQDGLMYALARDVTDRRRADVVQAVLRRVATLVAREASPGRSRR